jgi:hypothetical protein
MRLGHFAIVSGSKPQINGAAIMMMMPRNQTYAAILSPHLHPGAAAAGTIINKALCGAHIHDGTPTLMMAPVVRRRASRGRKATSRC